uniref:Uncharacterized protein n=1 Tax=Nelumbo nucifera TaxID=4432 RepID=A0A822ZLK0_NELNU|nr:TPA_asm: hypothetical protein HUJ06_000858 [Nelumbo nucifera]
MGLIAGEMKWSYQHNPKKDISKLHSVWISSCF